MERHDPRRPNRGSDFAFLPETGGDGGSRGQILEKPDVEAGWDGDGLEATM